MPYATPSPSPCTPPTQPLPPAEQERTRVGLATFDSSIHFYAMRGPGTQPQMLVVCDTQDVFAPTGAPLMVPVGPNKAELQVRLCVCVCACVRAPVCVCVCNCKGGGECQVTCK